MSLLFVIASVLAVLAAVGVVLSRETLYSALSLVVHVAMLSVLFLLLNAQFLFVVQLIIYAGAVMVLFVFIIALLSPGRDDSLHVGGRALLGGIGVVAVTAVIGIAAYHTFGPSKLLTAPLYGSTYDPFHSFAATPAAVNANGNIQSLAETLFSEYLLPFEVTSLLLLVAAVGAVYLTRGHRGPNFGAERGDGVSHGLPPVKGKFFDPHDDVAGAQKKETKENRAVPEMATTGGLHHKHVDQEQE